MSLMRVPTAPLNVITVGQPIFDQNKGMITLTQFPPILNKLTDLLKPPKRNHT
jgi:hypothetical protein